MEKISAHQFMMTSAAVLLGTTFFPIAQTVAGEAGRDGWWAVLPGFSIAVPFGLMGLALIKQYPGQNFMQITETLIGKWVSKGIALVYILASGLFGTFLLSQVADTFKRSVLPLVPDLALMGGTLLLIVFLYYLGLEVFARFIEVVFPVVVLSLIFTMLFSIPRFEWDQFWPVLAEGIKPITFAAVKITPYAAEYLLFLAGLVAFISIKSDDYRQLKTGIWRSVIFVGVLDTLIVLTEIIVFGPGEAKRLNYGLMILGSMVEIARTLSGIESLFMVFWMGAMIIKVGAFFFMTNWGLNFFLGVKSPKIKGYVFLATAAVFLAGAHFSLPGSLFLKGIEYVDNYLILPLALTWIVLLWVLVYGKRWLKGKAGGRR